MSSDSLLERVERLVAVHVIEVRLYMAAIQTSACHAKAAGPEEK